MELDCAGCAGCCIDWRPIAPEAVPSESHGRRRPLDDVPNLVPLTRDEVADFVADGFGDVLVPRLFEPAGDDDRVSIDGRSVAAVGDRPVFVIGLEKPLKPVAPFGTEPHWLSTCAFLDPETLQCRIYETDRYPQSCSAYPGYNLQLDRETECERVERAFGGERLLDATPPEDLPPPFFSPAALGSKIFAYPSPTDLSGVVRDIERGDLSADARATFVGAAVGSSPGSIDVDEQRASQAEAATLEAASWVGEVTERPAGAAGGTGRGSPPDPGDPADDGASAEWAAFERDAGAPDTPGW